MFRTNKAVTTQVAMGEKQLNAGVEKVLKQTGILANILSL